MTTVTVYRQSDTSAPTLTGQVGSLTTLLNACLVTGYGSQPAAGWTSVYSGTNTRQFKNSAVDGTGTSVWVDDNGGGPGGAQEAFATGFITMTAAATGTGQFPTSSQQAMGVSVNGAINIRKSATANATARNWTLIADDTCFYLFTESGDQTSPLAAFPYMFGDIFSYKTSDPYRCMTMGRNSQNNGTDFRGEWFPTFSGNYNVQSASDLRMTYFIPGHFMSGSFTGTGTSTTVGKHSDAFKCGVNGGGVPQNTGGLQQYNNIGFNGSWMMGNNANQGYCMNNPNGPDGGLWLAPIWVHHTGNVRGYLKGLWNPCQFLPLNHNDTFSGSGTLAGKSFVVQNMPSADNNNNLRMSQVFIETSSTWS
jgi:hypothetical protein